MSTECSAVSEVDDDLPSLGPGKGSGGEPGSGRTFFLVQDCDLGCTCSVGVHILLGASQHMQRYLPARPGPTPVRPGSPQKKRSEDRQTAGHVGVAQQRSTAYSVLYLIPPFGLTKTPTAYCSLYGVSPPFFRPLTGGGSTRKSPGRIARNSPLTVSSLSGAERRWTEGRGGRLIGGRARTWDCFRTCRGLEAQTPQDGQQALLPPSRASGYRGLPRCLWPMRPSCAVVCGDRRMEPPTTAPHSAILVQSGAPTVGCRRRRAMKGVFGSVVVGESISFMRSAFARSMSLLMDGPPGPSLPLPARSSLPSPLPISRSTGASFMRCVSQ